MFTALNRDLLPVSRSFGPGTLHRQSSQEPVLEIERKLPLRYDMADNYADAYCVDHKRGKDHGEAGQIRDADGRMTGSIDVFSLRVFRQIIHILLSISTLTLSVVEFCTVIINMSSTH